MIIGLTGGIGSGKSTVADIFKDHGYSIVDADEIQKEITGNNSPITDELENAFKTTLRKENGMLDRGKLSNIAFSSDENTKLLNSIVTTKIIDIAKERLKGNCVFDAPTLFENNLQSICDKTLVVTADTDIRVDRVVKRDGFSRHDVLNRIARQMPEEEKIKLADFVIYNNGTKDELLDKISKLIDNINISC